MAGPYKAFGDDVHPWQLIQRLWIAVVFIMSDTVYDDNRFAGDLLAIRSFNGRVPIQTTAESWVWRAEFRVFRSQDSGSRAWNSRPVNLRGGEFTNTYILGKKQFKTHPFQLASAGWYMWWKAVIWKLRKNWGKIYCSPTMGDPPVLSTPTSTNTTLRFRKLI